MKIFFSKIKYGLFFLIPLFFSCSTLVHNAQVKTLTQNYCAPNVDYKSTSTAEISVADSITLRKVFSYHDYVLIKYLDLTTHMITFMDSSSNRVQRFSAKQKITEKYMLFNTELHAMAAELDCNGERIDKLGGYLDELNSKSQTRLTVASILLGAITAVTSTTVKNDHLNNGLSIAGGVGTAVLGFMTLNPKGKRVNMIIQRNMLHNIWYRNNDDHIYPASVWGILSEKKFSNSEDLSMVETTRQRWLKYGLDGQVESPLEQLYFKTGGVFTAEQLHTLANMHNELQATVRSIQQDMRSLIQTVNLLD